VRKLRAPMSHGIGPKLEKFRKRRGCAVACRIHYGPAFLGAAVLTRLMERNAGTWWALR
jgi:hypothetical protein